MIRYTIHTEDKHREGVEEVVAKYFHAYTILAGRAYWNGEPEPTLVIVYYGELEAMPLVESCARFIKDRNEQSSVLIASEEVHVSTI